MVIPLLMDREAVAIIASPLKRLQATQAEELVRFLVKPLVINEDTELSTLQIQVPRVAFQLEYLSRVPQHHRKSKQNTHITCFVSPERFFLDSSSGAMPGPLAPRNQTPPASVLSSTSTLTKDTRYSFLEWPVMTPLLSVHRTATWPKYFRSFQTKRQCTFSPPPFSPTSLKYPVRPVAKGKGKDKQWVGMASVAFAKSTSCLRVELLNCCVLPGTRASSHSAWR